MSTKETIIANIKDDLPKKIESLTRTPNPMIILYTAKDQAWVNRVYLPYIADRYFVRDEDKGRILIGDDMINKYGLPAKIITITGNGGTGKSFSVISLVGTSNRCVCMASTVAAGNVLKQYLTEHITPITPVIFLTIYKYFGITPHDVALYLHSVFGNDQVPLNVQKGSCESLRELWLKIYPYMVIVCDNMIEKKFESRECGWISPDDYNTVRKHLPKKSESDNRTENERVVHHLLMCLPESKIPTPLIYDEYVIDEAERDKAFFLLLIIFYHYYVHSKYDTDEQIGRAHV